MQNWDVELFGRVKTFSDVVEVEVDLAGVDVLQKRLEGVGGDVFQFELYRQSLFAGNVAQDVREIPAVAREHVAVGRENLQYIGACW